MSFDLYFCIHNGDAFDASLVYKHFAGTPCFQMHSSAETSFQAWYQNEVTGIYCSFDFEREAKDPEDARLLAPGFTDTGLSFNLNYLRPSFFAHETMTLVEQVAAKFNLLVVDPQESEGETETPGPSVASELVVSWERHNEAAVSALLNAKDEEEIQYVYYPRDLALDWWRYAKGKEKLQTDLGDDVFVPTIFLMQKGKDSRLRSVVMWSDALPQVIPPCDQVIKQTMKRNWRGKMVTKLMQILPYESLLSAIGHIVQPVEGPIRNLKLLSAQRSSEIKKAFDQLAGPPFEPRQYKTLASDRFVDVLVPERLTPAS